MGHGFAERAKPAKTSPSPLNGERAGVRGGNGAWLSTFLERVRRTTPHPHSLSPLRGEGGLNRGVLCKVFAFLLLVGALHQTEAAQTNSTKPTVMVLSGAPGEDDFGKVFAEATESWRQAAQKADAHFIEIGTASHTSTNDLEVFRTTLSKEPTNSLTALWIVLIGHGTFDGRETKFNLLGPDLSAGTLSNLLAGFQRPVAIINGASSSAPFIKSLSGKNRVVVTATRSGSEENFTRFGKFIAQTIGEAEADLDKDGQTSLLEAFLMASRRVNEFYKTEGRLATEHALIDDNGDGLGTPADWFRGIRAVKKSANNSPLDGTRAHQWHLIRSTQDQKLTPEQRQRRDDLELEISQLRQLKSTLEEGEYYSRLEKLLTELGGILEPR